MLNNDSAKLLITGILFILALSVSFFIGAEVVRIVRDFAAQLRGNTRSTEAEPSAQADAKQAATRRNRATVERLINKFEERESPPPASRPNE